MEDAAATMPAPSAPPQPGPAVIIPWSTGLFGCMEDPENCCLTFLCPCVTFGRVAEIVDRGATSSGASAALYVVVGVLTAWECQWVYSCFYRGKMRAQYGLQEAPLPDCCVHFLFEPCAICQEYRELAHRGFVMDIGWHANMERRNGAGAATTTTVPPAVHADGMTR